MEIDLIELIKRLLKIYDEEGECNEVTLRAEDVIFMIEIAIKISKIRGKI